MCGSETSDHALTTICLSHAAYSHPGQISRLSNSEAKMESQKAFEEFLQFCSVERRLRAEALRVAVRSCAIRPVGPVRQWCVATNDSRRFAFRRPSCPIGHRPLEPPELEALGFGPA